MTISPLCEYIAVQLQTPLFVYTASGNLIDQYPADRQLNYTSSISPELLSRLCENAPSDYPAFSFVQETNICFVHFSITQVSPAQIIIIGPFRMLFTESLSHAKHILNVTGFHLPKEQDFPNVYPPQAIRLALLLFNCCQSAPLTETDCLRKNFDAQPLSEAANKMTTADIFSNRENQKMHNPYTQELRLLKSIEDGDVEMLQQIWKETLPGTLGTTAKDPIRNGKNMAIYNITACGRAAIRAGLSAEHIFSLTDSYSQQIEGLENMLLLQSLVENAELHFAQMVAELKAGKQKPVGDEHPLIRRCKDYIFKHLHDPLSVSQVAEELQVHPNYLNTLFRRQEGKSLYQYILGEKINLTKNLLTYSDYSYLEIAHYLGFLSQSHLGTRFKNITGMTLKQYRDMYRKNSFF